MSSISAGSAVIYAFKVEGGRPWYLLLRRAAETSGAGAWATVESEPAEGEGTARAAVRALLAETSLDPRALWALERVETAFDPFTDSIRLRPVYAALVDGEIRLSAAWDASRWFSEKEAATSLRSEQQRASLDEIHRTIGAVAGRGQEPDARLRLV